MQTSDAGRPVANSVRPTPWPRPRTCWMCSTPMSFATEDSAPGCAPDSERSVVRRPSKPPDCASHSTFPSTVSCSSSIPPGSPSTRLSSASPPDPQGGVVRQRDPLVGEGVAGDLPAVARPADEAVVGNEDVVEEDLVEQCFPGDLAQRADVEAAGLDVDEEVGRGPCAWGRRGRCGRGRMP